MMPLSLRNILQLAAVALLVGSCKVHSLYERRLYKRTNAKEAVSPNSAANAGSFAHAA